MKNILNAVPGYRIFEYLLVITPHEELRNRIIHIKQQFAESYKTQSRLFDRPHIMLASFTQYEQMEERILNKLKIVAMGHHPAKIELKDYGSFPSHTIFIKLNSREAIQQLVRTIRSEAQQLMKLDKENKPHFILEPHITIARKLQPWQYEKGWLEYNHKHFTGRFIADGMLLLRRPVNELKYQVLQRFEFQNLPVNTKQGQLFG